MAVQSFVVPQPGHPATPEEMEGHEKFVDALHTLECEWDGDDSGLVFHTEGGELRAWPGDLVTIESPDKFWITVKGDHNVE